MGFTLGSAETYDEDLPLFRKLNLNTFSTDTSEELYVGKVETNEYSINLWVTCIPAQFWKAEILCKSSKKLTSVTTGSGGLLDYWSIFELIGQDMLVFGHQIQTS